MEDKDNKPLTATTVRELGIELSGFKDLTALQFKALTDSIVALTQTLNTAIKDKADRSELASLRQIVEQKATLTAVQAQEEDIAALKKSKGLVWVYSTLSAVFGAILFFLIQYVILN